MKHVKTKYTNNTKYPYKTEHPNDMKCVNTQRTLNLKILAVLFSFICASLFLPLRADAFLTAPTGIKAAATVENHIALSWDAVPETDYYLVFRSPAPDGLFSPIASALVPSFTDTGVFTGSTYYYKVHAVGKTGSSEFSAVVSATANYATGQVAAVTNLKAEPAGPTEIYLSWDTVPYASQYEILKSSTYDGQFTLLRIVYTTNFTDTVQFPREIYYYKVRAAGITGQGPDSEIVYSTARDPNALLYPPLNFKAEAVADTQIRLTWDAVSGAGYYNIHRTDSPGGIYHTIGISTGTDFTDGAVFRDVVYYYKINAVGNGGASDYSAVEQVTARFTGSPPPSSTPEPPPEVPDLPPSGQENPEGQEGAPLKFSRLAGQDLYATAAAISKAGWTASDYAVLVSGENYPDALCSAPLAFKYKAPVLLTARQNLNDFTKAELSRLNVKQVFIVGGTGVVSAVAEQSVKNMGIEVTRIAGFDRYETSLLVAEILGSGSQAVVAAGESFPDALSVAAIAAMKGMPILLTPRDRLPDSVGNYLAANIRTTYVVGGTGVISDAVFRQLPGARRLSGLDRYETNAAVLTAFAAELDFSTCYISTGEKYADALAGSALAALSGSPVVLTDNPPKQSTLNFLRSKLSLIREEVIFGGTAVVPRSVIGNLK